MKNLAIFRLPNQNVFRMRLPLNKSDFSWYRRQPLAYLLQTNGCIVLHHLTRSHICHCFPRLIQLSATWCSSQWLKNQFCLPHGQVKCRDRWTFYIRVSLWDKCSFWCVNLNAFFKPTCFCWCLIERARSCCCLIGRKITYTLALTSLLLAFHLSMLLLKQQHITLEKKWGVFCRRLIRKKTETKL